MMDSITPQDIHTSILKFAKGGILMPEEVQKDIAEFQEELTKGNLTSEERSAFEQAIANIRKQYPDSDEMEAVGKSESSANILSGGNWFKQHPEKLLGDIKVDTDRYGKEIKVLQGDLSVLDRISLNSDLKQLSKKENVGVSSQGYSTTQEIESNPSVKAFVENVIETSNVSIGKKAVVQKRKKDDVLVTGFEPKLPKIQSYKDIYKSLNPKISDEELRVYVWYKEYIGQRLSKEWYDLAFGEERAINKIGEEQIITWVKNGLLFFYNGDLLPSPLYLSGNLYEKTTRLVKTGENSGQDIDEIVNKYGVQILENQLKRLNEAFQVIYQNRLIITGKVDENALILKPTSKFAKSFMIKRTESMEEFKWWYKIKSGIRRPDFDKVDGKYWQQLVFDALSLTDAFCLWLVVNRYKLEFRSNITYNDIIYFYINKKSRQAPSYLSEAKEREWKAALERTKSNAASEGNRLFLEFLSQELDLNQKVQIETNWNAKYNNYLKVDYEKIPVAFNITNSFFGEEPFVVKHEKREAVSFIFNEGSGCLAYDVGVGKSLSAIMIMEQFIVAGYSKRPFLVVPNQTYKQWLSEIKNALPHRKINGLFNLGADYLTEVLNEKNEITKVDEGSISVLTYEGFYRLGFNETTQKTTMASLYEILNQGGAEEQMTEKKKAGFYEKLETLVGRGLKGTNIEIESLGFDFVCYDEAHALKKVFTSIKGEAEEQGKKAKKQYSIQSGIPSDMALKGFMISNYILRNNNYRNVLMLTATPFTNSPLEVFSMLSLVAYHHLDKLGIVNINDFFDNFIDVNSELVINHKLQPQYKQVVKGFNNLPSLQKIIFRFFNYKDGEDVGVIRPNKIVIPYTKKLVNGSIVNLPESEQVTSNIEMSDIQKQYMSDIIAYAEEKISLEQLASSGRSGLDDLDEEPEETESTLTDSDASTFDDEDLDEDEKKGVRALRAMDYSRSLALSPFLYKYNTLGTPTYESYINTSPKLKYVMECVKSVKTYHEKNNEPVSGQVIYMDRGLIYFDLIRDYLIYVVGFKPHEVSSITAKLSVDKKRKVQDAFLGRKYNEKTKEYENIPDSERIKVLLGSSSIKEGINLQTKSTVLYNCFLDWNPTDVIQLQGRIWRQKNEFANVRIVNPLVIDSMDIFMFQKLEEKTARINTIWSANGKSVFKLEELDPEEIKYALIKDPRVIASLESETKKVKIQDDINSYRVVNERLQSYRDVISKMEYRKRDIDDILMDIAPEKVSNDIISKINYLIGIWKAEYPKDSQGRYLISSYERDYQFQATLEELKVTADQISPFDKPNRPYWFTEIVEGKRLVEKEEKDLLSPRNIDKNNVSDYIVKSNEKIKDLEQEIKQLQDKDFIERRTQEIIEYRERNKIVIKSVNELVAEFGRLNYLLSIKMAKGAKAPKEPFAYKREVFFDENGVRKIDAATIELLTRGVETLPQTKDLHIDVNGEYSYDRQLLHYEIINDFKRNINCVESDEPIAILTGGSPASGKTTFLKRFAPFLTSDELVRIDADEIRAKLPEYQGWNASTTHLETKDIVNQLLSDREIGVPCQFDLIYDGTMNSSKNYKPLIGLLHSLGYKVFIVYMDNVPYDVVKERMLKRYQSSGRFVPMEVIDDFYSKGKVALDELKQLVEGYIVVDASNSNYDIIERGGIELPQSRNYSLIGSKTKTSNLVDKLITAAKFLTNE